MVFLNSVPDQFHIPVQFIAGISCILKTACNLFSHLHIHLLFIAELMLQACPEIHRHHDVVFFFDQTYIILRQNTLFYKIHILRKRTNYSELCLNLHYCTLIIRDQFSELQCISFPVSGKFIKIKFFEFFLYYKLTPDRPFILTLF